MKLAPARPALDPASPGARAGLVLSPATSPADPHHDLPLHRDPRHLLGLEGLGRGEILGLLDSAGDYRARLRAGGKPFDDLCGATLLLGFFEGSTRPQAPPSAADG